MFQSPNRTVAITLILMMSLTSAFAISGVVLDDLTQKPLAWVNIGIVNAGIGTTSGSDGHFTLDIPDSLKMGVLKFSIVGYEPMAYSLPMKCGSECVIILRPISYSLNEIVINPLKTKRVTAGNTNCPSFIGAYLADPKPGYEVGTLMKVKKNKRSWLKKVIIEKNNVSHDSILFRINVYELTKDGPGENLLKKPVYFLYRHELGNIFSIDLTKYELSFEGNFIVTMELVNPQDDLSFVYRGKFFGAPSYYRKVSQGKWEKHWIAIGISAELVQEK